jgi:hypothetical protein
MFLKMTGTLTSPKTSKSLPPSPSIADIGTGTSVWLQALAGKLPSARLDGFDMDPSKFPTEGSLGSNIRMMAHSILKLG